VGVLDAARLQSRHLQKTPPFSVKPLPDPQPRNTLTFMPHWNWWNPLLQPQPNSPCPLLHPRIPRWRRRQGHRRCPSRVTQISMSLAQAGRLPPTHTIHAIYTRYRITARPHGLRHPHPPFPQPPNFPTPPLRRSPNEAKTKTPTEPIFRANSHNSTDFYKTRRTHFRTRRASNRPCGASLPPPPRPPLEHSGLK
jgi:hypothetical protein